jgi:hypothetical protein
MSQQETSAGPQVAVAAGMSSEEFVEAWTTKATKNRLQGLDWNELHLNTLLVDPPRVRFCTMTACIVFQDNSLVFSTL